MVDLGAVPETGLTHSASTKGGSVDNATSVLNYCGISSESYFYVDSSPTKAFMLGGTNATLTASVYVTYDGRNFDGVIALETGSCGDFECVEGVETHSSRSLSWTGEVGSNYFILVSGCCGLGSAGDFVLTVRDSESFEIGGGGYDYPTVDEGDQDRDEGNRTGDEGDIINIGSDGGDKGESNSTETGESSTNSTLQDSTNIGSDAGENGKSNNTGTGESSTNSTLEVSLSSSPVQDPSAPTSGAVLFAFGIPCILVVCFALVL